MISSGNFHQHLVAAEMWLTEMVINVFNLNKLFVIIIFVLFLVEYAHAIPSDMGW